MTGGFAPERLATEPFAAIADVHGNRWALEAVLEDIDRRGIRSVVNLGDNLFGPLDPAGTADLLIARDFPSVSGNQDREREGLSDSRAAWLAGMPLTLELPGILMFHGTPSKDDQYLLETVRAEGVTPASDDEIADRLGAVTQPLLLCGHTHIPRVVPWRNHLIVNPGSVGLAGVRRCVSPFPHRMETGSPLARYAVLEPSDSGWHVDLVSIPYDRELAARKVH